MKRKVRYQTFSKLPVLTKLQTATVPSDYFCNLDANLLRLDLMERPELTKGTVDFAVDSSKEYWSKNPPPQMSMPYYSPDPLPTGSRQPEPLDIVFAFDVSSEAVASGFLEFACAILKGLLYGGENNLDDPCFSRNGRMTIITFDSTLHFYDLTVRVIPYFAFQIANYIP